MAKRLHILVSGRVQNVGFRQFTASQAEHLGISGWVRNLAEGRQVEIEAQGDEEALDVFLARIRRGPAGARVEQVDLREQPLAEQVRGGFYIVPGLA